MNGRVLVMTMVSALAAWSTLQAADLPTTVALPSPLPSHIDRVEVVLVDGREPSATVQSARAVPPPPSRQPVLIVDGRGDNVLDVGREIGVDGGCVITRLRGAVGTQLRVTGRGLDLCRIGIPLGRPESMMDLLSARWLRVGGAGLIIESLTLSDRHGQQATVEPGATLADTDGAALSIEIDLESFARRVDLRDVVALTLAVRVNAVRGTVGPIGFVPDTVTERGAPRIGFWMWDYLEAIADPEALAAACREAGCDRLLLQIPASDDADAVWTGYARTLAALQEAGLEVYALDGAPELIDDPDRVVATIHRLRRALDGQPLAGLQLDIEPYLLKDFATRADGYRQYLSTVRRVKAVLGSDTRLSMVMPFWFAAVREAGRPVAFAVMDLVEEVAVMSYRTDLDELQAIADDLLRYGDLIRKPVWLALETRVLPLERHMAWQRVHEHRLATAYVDRPGERLVLAAPPRQSTGEWFRLVHQYAVQSERLSYGGQSRQAVQRAVATSVRQIRNRSFTGMLIHDVTGYQLLPADELRKGE